MHKGYLVFVNPYLCHYCRRVWLSRRSDNHPFVPRYSLPVNANRQDNFVNFKAYPLQDFNAYSLGNFATEELSTVMKLCNQEKQEVIVHGGLTNLVGATQTEKKQLVISLDKMNQIEEIDEKSRTITVQAGVILENAIDAAADKNLLLPLSFGAKGSAQVGGVVSTNAGGLRVFRYGMTRQMVLGLEAVLPDGTIISSLKKIIKDNSGYDLKQLFIGAEGTLGIVTKVVFRLQEKPQSRSSSAPSCRR